MKKTCLSSRWLRRMTSMNWVAAAIACREQRVTLFARRNLSDS